MSSLAEVIAWKYDNAPGIRTRERRDADGKPDGSGVMEIFDWPEALGPEPTTAQIAQWTGEFNALPPTQTREQIAATAIRAAPDDAAKWAAMLAYLDPPP